MKQYITFEKSDTALDAADAFAKILKGFGLNVEKKKRQKGKKTEYTISDGKVKFSDLYHPTESQTPQK